MNFVDIIERQKNLQSKNISAQRPRHVRKKLVTSWEWCTASDWGQKSGKNLLEDLRFSFHSFPLILKRPPFLVLRNFKIRTASKMDSFYIIAEVNSVFWTDDWLSPLISGINERASNNNVYDIHEQPLILKYLNFQIPHIVELYGSTEGTIGGINMYDKVFSQILLAAIVPKS